MEFEWDNNKNLINIRVHGIDFLDACRIFEHPMLVKGDTRKDYGEQRLVGLGLLYETVIVIVFTKRGNAIRVISHGGQIEMSAKSTKKILKSRTNMAKLRRKDDKSINYEDSPATTKKFWNDAQVFMPQHKVHISLRLDEDIVNFFKEEGSGYQSRINAVLKAYVNSHAHK